ncbi:MAG: nucleotidyltransferase domain-containing protein [Defluviitaleaceae bacterium]|nr:nucleotidyltransferase domain-containing protein [Defluviitaleaceae bacterium]
MSFYTFKPEYPEPFSLIHPLKVEQIRALASEDMPNCIDTVILFGSSLDLTCTPISDVDLYVLCDDEKKSYAHLHKLCKALKIKADILTSDAETFMEEALDINSVERQVLNQGVVIYEKESNPA